MTEPRQNIELKALDPDPAATRASALAAGAEPAGVLEQRDTYFEVARGRLKLRESGGTGTLIAYVRPDDTASTRISSYHLAEVADPAAALAGLTATHGVLAVVAKRRELLLSGCVRIHLDAVEGLPPHVELEGVIAASGDSAGAAAEVAALRAALGIGDEHLRSGSYADMLAAQVDAGLLADARAAQARAYAPYSRLRVGAAVRGEDGASYAGANVENAAFPLGNCAEVSALAALVAAGGRTVTEVAVASDTGVAPCGGCRQRLAEFAAPAAPVALIAGDGTTVTLTLGQLLPHGFSRGDLPGEAA